MKRMGNIAVQNAAFALAGFFLLGAIAGLIPKADELLTSITDAGAAHGEGVKPLTDAIPNVGEARAANAFDSGWRYTKNGWQNRKNWQKPSPVEKPSLDPLIVGLCQLFLCLAVLVAFSSQKTP